MAENGPIEELAKIISNKIFERFKWKQMGPFDQDFLCVFEDKHKPQDKVQAHKHPVDVVFHYRDPYLNKTIYLNTDLKSYAKGSLTPRMIEQSLKSLAKTIECAQYSPEWSTKYHTTVGNFEVRGMLFVYNHDNDFEHDFYDFFYPPKPTGKARRATAVNLDRIPISADKQIHIIDPKIINYMLSITADMNEMIAEGSFPSTTYGFYYPQLTYHKVVVSDDYLPATVESLAAPFLIVKHDAVLTYNREQQREVESNPAGFVIYYNREGETDLEFLYLLDLLSNYQILNRNNNIRIRVTAKNKSDSIRSNFVRALEKYAYEWGFDEEAKAKLYRIELHIVPMVKEFYSSEQISWEY